MRRDSIEIRQRLWLTAGGKATGRHTAHPDPTPTGPPAGCEAHHRPVGRWPGGFQGEVTVRNSGAIATTGWTARLTLPAGDRVTQSCNARLTQDGAEATARDAGGNGALPPGGQTSFGFPGSGDGGTAPTVGCASARPGRHPDGADARASRHYRRAGSTNVTVIYVTEIVRGRPGADTEAARRPIPAPETGIRFLGPSIPPPTASTYGIMSRTQRDRAGCPSPKTGPPAARRQLA
ncbi:cellulose binding domain-containing protein [Micromonospora citrea]|uniref:cellulose binding domain-containing protein n=1 Tax=Micromonospora citrea TaxID=47855 RepID=UPI000B846938